MAFVSLWLGAGHADLMTAYLNSPWSVHCRAQRGVNNDFTGVNYATFWVQPGVNPLFQTTAASNNYHSEKEVWLQINGTPGLDSIALPAWRLGEGAGMPKQTADAVALTGTQVLVVYTERQPCGTCSPFLNEALPNGTLVGWHFPWPSAETKKHKHDDDSVVVGGLMAMSRGVSYKENAKKYQRTDRVEGNKGLSGAVKKIRTKLGVQHKSPWLIT